MEALNTEHTVLEELNYAGSGKTELELRSLLGCFLFSGDDVEKKIKILSGGEKARVALAKTIISKANFLLLDEPTNHLDIHSVDLLIEALNKYEGTYILVSHDRYFVNKTANKIWEIEDYEVKEFIGTYDELERWKGEKKIKENKEPEKKTIVEKLPPKEKKQGKPESNHLLKDLSKLKKEFAQLEEMISKGNDEKSLLEKNLALPEIYADAKKYSDAEAAYRKKSTELEVKNKQYELLFEKILDIESKIN